MDNVFNIYKRSIPEQIILHIIQERSLVVPSTLSKIDEECHVVFSVVEVY